MFSANNVLDEHNKEFSPVKQLSWYLTKSQFMNLLPLNLIVYWHKKEEKISGKASLGFIVILKMYIFYVIRIIILENLHTKPTFLLFLTAEI